MADIMGWSGGGSVGLRCVGEETRGSGDGETTCFDISAWPD